jgi:hypothetical protein
VSSVSSVGIYIYIQYVYIYTHTHTHIYVYVYIYRHIYICTYHQMKTVPRRTPKKGVAKGVSKVALATRGGPAPRGRRGVVRRARMAPGKTSGDRRR